MSEFYPQRIKIPGQQEYFLLPPLVKEVVKRVGLQEFARCVGMKSHNLAQMLSRDKIRFSTLQRIETAMRLCADRMDSGDRFEEFRKTHPRVAIRLLKAVAQVAETPIKEVRAEKWHTPLLSLWNNYIDARHKLCAEFERIVSHDKNNKVYHKFLSHLRSVGKDAGEVER